MRAIVLYRPNSDHERVVLDMARDYKAQTNYELELLSLDTVEGDSLAGLYGIMEYPSILVLDNTRQLIKHWTGLPLPLINEVAGTQRL